MNSIIESAYVINEILAIDYAGKDDKIGMFDSEKYIKNVITLDGKDIQSFVNVTNEYLDLLKDKHLFVFFKKEQSSSIISLSKKTCRVKLLSDNIILLRFPNFFEVEKINELISEYQSGIKDVESIIIDIRDNGGGIDTAWLPLLPFVFPPEGSVRITEHLHLITARNLANRKHEISKYLTESVDENIQAFLGVLNTLKGDEGWFNFGFIKNPISISGFTNPKKVVILINNNSGSSTETFVQIARQSSKVTLLGCNTAGAWDYANVAYQELPIVDLLFQYPTSRNPLIDCTKSIDQIGINPDIYIQTLQENTTNDIYVERALSFIKNGQ